MSFIQLLPLFFTGNIHWRALTEQEILTAGLLGQTCPPQLEVKEMGPAKGRGVVVKEYIAQGQYVWEYRTYRVYPVGSEEERKLAEEYERNGEGSYVLQTAYPVPGVGCLCFEATRCFRDLGRVKPHPQGLQYQIREAPLPEREMAGWDGDSHRHNGRGGTYI